MLVDIGIERVENIVRRLDLSNWGALPIPGQIGVETSIRFGTGGKDWLKAMSSVDGRGSSRAPQAQEIHRQDRNSVECNVTTVMVPLHQRMLEHEALRARMVM